MKRNTILLLTITPLVILLDQVTKCWIESTLSTREAIQVIENLFHLTYVHNTGGAFGIFSGTRSPYLQALFIGATGAAIVFMGVLYFKLPTRHLSLLAGIALIMGGAIGNLIDRLRMGAVVDFIDVHYFSHHWPAFNVADSAITVGAFIVGVCSVMKKC